MAAAPDPADQRPETTSTRGWWAAQVVPRLVDVALDRARVRELRAEVCGGLTGRVLEIGFGSGPNLPLLPDAVTALDAVEPSVVAWRRSQRRREAARVPVSRIGLDGQRLEVDDAAYDSALCTFSLCTIPDAVAALREVRRALHPGARVHVLEHGRSSDPRARAWQERLDPLQGRLFDGCRLTRDPFALARDAGLEVLEEHAADLAPGPGRVVGHLRWGVLGVGGPS